MLGRTKGQAKRKKKSSTESETGRLQWREKVGQDRRNKEHAGP